MRATFIWLASRLALMFASAAFVLSALTFSPNVAANVLVAAILGSMTGATVWLLGTAFDLVVVSLKALPLLSLSAARPLALRRNRPQ